METLIAKSYEVCAQIRRISSLSDTPLIVTASNRGIVNRLSAKMVGASSFFSRPTQQKKGVNVLMDRLLHQYVEALKSLKLED